MSTAPPALRFRCSTFTVAVCPRLAGLVGLQQHLDRPERIGVAHDGHGRARRDGDARGDARRAGRCASACNDSRPREVVLPRQRRQVDVAQVQLRGRRSASAAGCSRASPTAGRCRGRRCGRRTPVRRACRGAASRARGRTCATSSGSLRPPALMPCDVGVARDARDLSKRAVRLGVDARALGERRQPHLVEQPAEIGSPPRPARRRSAGARDSPTPARSPSRP